MLMPISNPNIWKNLFISNSCIADVGIVNIYGGKVIKKTISAGQKRTFPNFSAIMKIVSFICKELAMQECV